MVHKDLPDPTVLEDAYLVVRRAGAFDKGCEGGHDPADVGPEEVPASEALSRPHDVLELHQIKDKFNLTLTTESDHQSPVEPVDRIGELGALPGLALPGRRLRFDGNFRRPDR